MTRTSVERVVKSRWFGWTTTGERKTGSLATVVRAASVSERSPHRSLTLAARTCIAPSQRPQEGDQVGFFLLGELEPLDEVEELDGVLQRQAAAVVQVRRTLLDTAQGERLDRPVARLVHEAIQ